MISFKDMTIRKKMMLLIVSISVGIYIASFGYLSLFMRQSAYRQASEYAQSQAGEYANLVTSEIITDFSLSRGLGWALQNFRDIPLEELEQTISPLLYEYLSRNPNFYSTWVSLELNGLLPDYDLPHGRVRYTWVRQNGRMIFQRDTLNLDGDDPGSLYYEIKQNMEETITNPYFYSYTGREEDQVLEVSPCIPIIINGEFAGLAGTDIILDRFQELIASITPMGVGYAYLLSMDGTIVAHPESQLAGRNIGTTRESYTSELNIQERITSGESFSHYYFDDYLGEDALYTYASIQIGNTNTLWSFAVAIPQSFITSQSNNILYRSVVVVLAGIAILAFVIYKAATNYTRPLIKMAQTLEMISQGDINNTKELEVKNNDEQSQMARNLNNLVGGLRSTAEFAEKIGKGELDSEFEKLGGNDMLGKALLEMRDSLKKARSDEEIRKKEDQRRNWATQGQARFADILRMNNDNLEDLGFNVIKSLVKYLDANQGGVFLLNDEDRDERFLELIGCYAFDRKKYLSKRIEIGEGLVGACFLEKKPINMTDIPQDYITITSGLGGENPGALLLIPLLLNEEVYGVIELASFKKFEPYQVEFIEKVAENIASTISTVKINLRTAYLLEQSQQQAEEMRAQEEEMRQNMEEMHATQEEMQRKDNELQRQLETSEKLFCIMEYDKDGVILRINDNFSRVSKYQPDELKGKHHSILFDNQEWKTSENYKAFWELLYQGKAVRGALRRVSREGKYFIIKGVTQAHFDDQGNIEKVVEITIDITAEASEQKNQ